MPQSHVDVEWTIVENDAEWERLHNWSAATVGSSDRTLSYGRLWWRMAALFCVLALVNGGGWQPKLNKHPPTAPELVASTPLAVGHVAGDLAGLLNIPIDAHTNADWQRRFMLEDELWWRSLWPHDFNQLTTDYHVLDQHGDRRVLNVTISTILSRQAYRQTRFYAYQAGGWQRIAPEESLWGVPQQLTTSSFVITFRDKDTQTVTAVAPQLERLYTIMRRNFGLPLTPPMEKLAIEISVTQLPGFPSTSILLKRPLRVASPAIYLAPVELTDEQILAQAIALLLIEHLLGQVEKYYALPSAWQPLRRSLRLWQLWDLDLPLSAWRDDVVKWLYLDLAAPGSRRPLSPPARYADLCAAHKLWLIAPIQMGIPLLCSSQRKFESAYFSFWYYFTPLTRLEQLNLPTPQYVQSEEMRDRGQTVALATLIEYAVATYGRERLPRLVAGLGQYESWDTLIPTVYGVSPAEFEAGWQTYLATHYGIALSNNN